MSTVETAVPILPSRDLSRAEAFYAYLGFQVARRGADYLQVTHGEIELHLYLADDLDPLVNSAGCYLRVSDPARMRSEWCGDGVSCLEVPGSEPYGETVFAVVDPDGNTLRYGPVSARAGSRV
ncbi:bleomycin resistance protein [Actinospica robiniae]|uniref:bleomycin resistance protein n=1 Tax=Actinospica robiniae TaxID=304901 RepID=UPI0003F5A08C|nr:VOC family protein [Actinospica robiniae]